MNIIKSFLVKQLILSIVLLGILLSLVIVSFGAYLNTAQQEKAQVIKQLVTNNVSHEAKLLARQLRQAYPLLNINIQQLDGANVYQSPASTEPDALSYPLLLALDQIPPSVEVVNQDHNVKLQFQVNLSNELAFFDTLMLTILLIELLLAVISLWLVKQGLHSTFGKVSAHLSQRIAAFVNRPAQGPEFSWQSIPESFSNVVAEVKKMATAVDLQMSELKDSSEQLKTEAFTDDLTGLPNRNRFVQYFEEHLREEDSLKFGALAIIRCTELQSINQTRGYQEGDKYVTDVMGLIKSSADSYDKQQTYRLNGADFACVLPNITLKKAEEFAQSLTVKFNEHQRLAEIDSVAYTGVITYQPGKQLGEILALADTAISIAQTKQSNAWHSQKESDILDNNSASYGNQNWRQVIDDVIANNRVSLMHQLIQPSSRGNKAYSEVLTRFKTSEQQILPTASFLAMAEKLDKIVQIDRMIVESTLQQIKNQNLSEQFFGINVTPRTVHDEQFMIWLERRLIKDPAIAAKLVFEVSEYGLQQNIKASKRFIDMVHRVGGRVTVERFGVGLTSFKFFRDLKPDFIKMDGTYTRGIDEDKNNQYFMRLMVDLAHRIGVGVFAEGVETQEEKHVLEQLFIDGTQGYYIGKPVPF